MNHNQLRQAKRKEQHQTMRILKAIALLGVLAVAGAVRAQQAYWVEKPLTNYTATITGGNDTNTSTQIIAVPTAGTVITRINVVPATNVCFAIGRAATTNDRQITASAPFSWTVANAEKGPYVVTNFFARDTRGATNLTTTATVEVWGIPNR